jgi:hypothetical protein
MSQAPKAVEKRMAAMIKAVISGYQKNVKHPRFEH